MSVQHQQHQQVNNSSTWCNPKIGCLHDPWHVLTDIVKVLSRYKHIAGHLDRLDRRADSPNTPIDRAVWRNCASIQKGC